MSPTQSPGEKGMVQDIDRACHAKNQRRMTAEPEKASNEMRWVVALDPVTFARGSIETNPSEIGDSLGFVNPIVAW